MALKTNSKELKEVIKNYIIEGFHNSDFESWRNVCVTDYNQICSIILSAFWKEKVELDKSRVTETQLFFDWAQGLPSILNCDYYYNVDAVELLGEWLQETEEEKKRYTDSQSCELITKLLWRELNANGKYLPRVSKKDFLSICGDYATFESYGRSKAFGNPIIGYPHSTFLYSEDVHFTITL